MEKRGEDPRKPDELSDPKVPIIHSEVPGNRAQAHHTQTPVPQDHTMPHF